jgi:hypothetical protein
MKGEKESFRAPWRDLSAGWGKGRGERDLVVEVAGIREAECSF